MKNNKTPHLPISDQSTIQGRLIAQAALLLMTLFLLTSGAVAQTPEPGPNERIWEKDGSIQVWVPAGEFVMGVDDPEQPERIEERPPHKVAVDGFWMDKCEVTNAMFVTYFNEVNKAKTPNERLYRSLKPFMDSSESGVIQDQKTGELRIVPDRGKWPVMVSCYVAVEYCKAMGKWLPSEAQWEWAARGSDDRRYPWGNEWNPKWANVASDEFADVGSFPRDVSPFGVFDMAGNAREWCQDQFEVDYYRRSPVKNPLNYHGTFHHAGIRRVIRGGGYDLTEWDSRTTSRGWMYGPNQGLCTGFRCVVAGPPPKP